MFTWCFSALCQFFTKSVDRPDANHLQIFSCVRPRPLDSGFLRPLVWSLSALCPRIWSPSESKLSNYLIKTNSKCVSRFLLINSPVTSDWLDKTWAFGSPSWKASGGSFVDVLLLSNGRMSLNVTDRFWKEKSEPGSWTVRLIRRPASQQESPPTPPSGFTPTWGQDE